MAARAAVAEDGDVRDIGDGEELGGFLAAEAAAWGDAGSGWDTGRLPSPVV